MKKQFFKIIGSTLIVGLFLILAFGSEDSKDEKGTSETSNNENQSDGVATNEGTKNCIEGYDWVYPSSSNPTSAWKFSSDGSFNFSTTMFGGMSTWGNWYVISPGKIKISYTRSSEGVVPDDKDLTMSSCNSLKVGSTIYSKD
jgi:hypothetical protein